MPAHVAEGVRFFDDVGHVVEKNVRTDERLDDIECPRMGGELVGGTQDRVDLLFVMQGPNLASASSMRAR